MRLNVSTPRAEATRHPGFDLDRQQQRLDPVRMDEERLVMGDREEYGPSVHGCILHISTTTETTGQNCRWTTQKYGRAIDETIIIEELPCLSSEIPACIMK
jgi:hypothetical protein